ncbi:MAG: hypothetical protein WC313_02975 [Candidatus Kapaibacterium sp.]|jgi:hypothetical protein|nr:hypothetical protein [Candidatus Kapabacteria bacterium]
MKTRKELEQMLPDYAFGRLSEKDKADFESEINEHQDLLVEVKEVQSLFKKIDDMDFDSVLNDKTRNLHYKVNQRLSQHKSVLSGTAYLIRFGLPAAAVMVLLVSIFRFGIQNESNEVVSFSEKLTSLIESDNFYDTYSEYYDYSGLSTVELNQETDLLEYAGVEVDKINNNQELNNVVNAVIPMSEINFYNDLDDLSDDEFQILLEEIQNVEI